MRDLFVFVLLFCVGCSPAFVPRASVATGDSATIELTSENKRLAVRVPSGWSLSRMIDARLQKNCPNFDTITIAPGANQRGMMTIFRPRHGRHSVIRMFFGFRQIYANSSAAPVLSSTESLPRPYQGLAYRATFRNSHVVRVAVLNLKPGDNDSCVLVMTHIPASENAFLPEVVLRIVRTLRYAPDTDE